MRRVEKRERSEEIIKRERGKRGEENGETRDESRETIEEEENGSRREPGKPAGLRRSIANSIIPLSPPLPGLRTPTLSNPACVLSLVLTRTNTSLVQ